MENEVDGTKVRVVRCPKCERLLPEFNNFSVYRCGGCDATLQALRPARLSEASPAKRDGGNAANIELSESIVKKSGRVYVENGEMSSQNKSVLFGAKRPVQDCRISLPKADQETLTGIQLLNKDSEHQMCIGASSEADHKENNDQNIRDKPDRDHLVVGDEGSSVLKESSALASIGVKSENKGRIDARNFHQNEVTSSCFSSKERAGEEQNRKSVHGAWEDQKTQSNGEWMNKKPGPSRYSSPRVAYPDEGPSRCGLPRYQYGNGEVRQSKDESGKVGYLEQNQAELLRMLDQLRDQVQRTCEVTGKQNASGSVDRRTTFLSSSSQHDHVDCFPESSFLNRNPSRRSPVLHDRNTGMSSCCPSLLARSNALCCPDLPVHMGVPFHLGGQYPHRHVDNYINGHFDPASTMPYQHDGFYHQPACSCFHGYQRQYLAPTCRSATVVGQQRVPYTVNNHDIYPNDDPSAFGSRSTDSKVGKASHTLERRACHQAMEAKNAASYCEPLAGAAPFTVCFNCSELLQLPERSLLPKSGQFDLRCGSCFKVIPVLREGNRILSRTPALETATLAQLENNDYSSDSPDNTIQSIDEKLVLPYTFGSGDHEMLEKANDLILNKLNEPSQVSSSPATSEDIVSPESAPSQKHIPTSSEIPIGSHVISRVPSLPLREHFEYSSSDETDVESGHETMGKHSSQEQNKSSSGNITQNSAKMIQVATEMDVPEDEYPPAVFSQDSWDIMKEDAQDQPKVAKANDSFLAGFIRKNLRLNHKMGNNRYKVSINGHPIPDHLSKKAEKQAGPIYPGDYWYDYHAGFWGVMGHHCLGIILPFIEEFNFPMPKNCAGGNTGILVNGRELHEKDLDLLVGRGLPDNRGRSYIIDISGNVWDESSGEELDSLGKLAPTIERMKRGFGMRYPKSLS